MSSVALAGTLDAEWVRAARAALEAAGVAVVVEPEAAVLVVDGAVERVREAAGGGLHVVAVVEAVDRRRTTALLDAGAAAVVLADAIEALPHAVRAVAAGFVVVARQARRSLARAVLTKRQQEILGLVVLGLDNATIARRLFLSEHTVKTHMGTIYEKLGVRSRKEAVDLVLDPASNLGQGVLGFGQRREAPPPEGGYRPPEVSP